MGELKHCNMKFNVLLIMSFLSMVSFSQLRYKDSILCGALSVTKPIAVNIEDYKLHWRLFSDNNKLRKVLRKNYKISKREYKLISKWHNNNLFMDNKIFSDHNLECEFIRGETIDSSLENRKVQFTLPYFINDTDFLIEIGYLKRWGHGVFYYYIIRLTNNTYTLLHKIESSAG